MLTGAGIAHGINSMYRNLATSGNNGHFIMALDVTRWLPMEAYFDRFDAFVATLKDSSLKGEVLLPGEIRWRNYHANLKNGICLPESTRTDLSKFALPHGIALPW